MGDEVFMSEEVLDAGQVPAVEVEKIEPAVSKEIKSSEPTEEIKSEPEERKFTQAELNAHIAAEKRRTADKVRAQLAAEQQAAQRNAVEEEPQTYTPTQLREIYRQERQIEEQQKWANGVGESIESKVQQARIQDPEFGDTYEELGIGRIPYLAVHLDKVENTTDVMKELRNHPEKYASIINLMSVSPHMVDAALLKISKSIEENKKVATQKKANPPLDQVKPSNFDTGKSGGPAADVKNYLLKRRR